VLITDQGVKFVLSSGRIVNVRADVPVPLDFDIDGLVGHRIILALEAVVGHSI
jgi:hypothetical protein